MTNSNALGFGPFDGRVWLNCAHEGQLPQTAVAAAQEGFGKKPLVEKLPNGLANTRLLSALDEASRSAIVAVSDVDRQRNPEIHVAPAAAGIEIVLRNGDLRFSPPIYNTGGRWACSRRP